MRFAVGQTFRGMECRVFARVVEKFGRTACQHDAGEFLLYLLSGIHEESKWVRQIPGPGENGGGGCPGKSALTEARLVDISLKRPRESKQLEGSTVEGSTIRASGSTPSAWGASSVAATTGAWGALQTPAAGAWDWENSPQRGGTTPQRQTTSQATTNTQLEFWNENGESNSKTTVFNKEVSKEGKEKEVETGVVPYYGDISDEDEEPSHVERRYEQMQEDSVICK